MKCKCCGREREIYKGGYCEPCYDKAMDVIKTSRAALRQALDESKGPNPDKERVLALTDTACAALDNLTRDRVPFYNGGHKYVAQEIRRNLGASAGPRASAASPSPPLALTVALGVVLAALALVWANTLGDLRDERALNRDLTAQVEQLQATVADLDAQLEAVQKTAAAAPTVMLENGNFVAGTDFAAGTYDIEAVSGAGNVFSDNLIGGINAMMATVSENTSGFYEQKYSNIQLPDGTTLTVDGVKVRLRLVEAY